MRHHMTFILLAALLVTGGFAGCGPMSVPGIGPSPALQAVPFDAMPLQAATVASAVAIQTLTPPLESAQGVRFAPGASGPSETALALEGFEFTSATMTAFRPAGSGSPGMVAGDINYTCPLNRKAEFLFLAEYEHSGDAYLVHRLRVTPKYATTPRVKVFVLPLRDLPRQQDLNSYLDLVSLVAARAVSPAELRQLPGPLEVAVLAVSEDRTAPESNFTLGISASSAGSDCYNRDCRTYSMNGWPVAVLTGSLDPGIDSPLYAKVTFQDGLSRFSRNQVLCVHPLTGV